MREFWFEILSFTFLQSFLSASLSVLAGGMLARFLWCKKGLRLERPLKAIGALTFVMPVMVPALAFLLIFEGSYGLCPIVAVHVFLNALYCMSQLHGAYGSYISEAKLRQGALLRLTLWERLRHLEWPAISSMLLHTFMVVFCLSLSSFSIVLLLGGGPAATTLSVALYHALSVSVDLESAGFFLSLQVIMSLAFALALYRKPASLKEARVLPILNPSRNWGAEAFLLGLMILYALPLLKVLSSLLHVPDSLSDLASAAFLTLAIGVSVGALTVLMVVLLFTRHLHQARMMKGSASIVTVMLLSLPKIAFVGVVFLLAHQFLDHLSIAYGLIILVSLLCYAPFVVKSFLADFNNLQGRYSQQIQLLGLSLREVFQLIVWPHVHGKIKRKLAVVSCFAMGNLSVPLLLGQQEILTLPVLSYKALLRYETDLSGFYMACLLLLMGVVFALQRSCDVKN